MTPKRRLLAGLAAALAIPSACAAGTPLLNGESFPLESGRLSVQAREGEGPVTVMDDNVIRVTVAPGDQWANDKAKGKGNDRAELSSETKILFGESASAELDLRLFPMGAEARGKWATVFQLHGPNRKTLEEDSSFRPPAITAQVRGDRLFFIARGGYEEENKLYKRVLGSVPADFGNWHRLKVDARLGGDGRVVVSRDGEVVIDWTGPVGFDAGDRRHYWKLGIYRSSNWSESSQVDFKLFCVGLGGECGTTM